MNIVPVELRNKLPDFSFDQKLEVDESGQSYRDFYHLDFEQRYPGLKSYMGKTHVAGFDIVVHSYVPAKAKATVFVVHGYYDHVGIYTHLIRHLLKNNFAVVAYDLPGHGLSSGSRAAISSFRQYQPVFKKVVMLCRGKLPGPWHIVAQSTGGAITMEYLLEFAGNEQRIPFKGVVLLAPLVRPVHWFWNSKLHSLVSPFTRFVKRKFSPSSNDDDFLEFVSKKDPLQPRFLSANWVGALKQWIPYLERHQPVQFPILVIQGKSDQTVDWRHNLPILQKLFAPAEIQYLPKVRHHVVNELELYRKDVFSRVVNYLAPFSTPQ